MNHKTPLHLLLVEDQTAIAQNIADYMETQGHIMDFAVTGPRGLHLALTQYYDVVILDLMLPGMDGLELCHQLRNQSDRHVPVLMLTARDTVQDKILGFKQGADDYLTKPFALEELLMRCLALSRRHQLHKEKQINIGALVMDTQRKQVMRQGKPVQLSSMGYRILQILANAYPEVVTRSELCQRLWGDDLTESDSLRSHIYQLRKALDNPFDKILIKTVHGVGFTLDIEE